MEVFQTLRNGGVGCFNPLRNGGGFWGVPRAKEQILGGGSARVEGSGSGCLLCVVAHEIRRIGYRTEAKGHDKCAPGMGEFPTLMRGGDHTTGSTSTRRMPSQAATASWTMGTSGAPAGALAAASFGLRGEFGADWDEDARDARLWRSRSAFHAWPGRFRQ